MPRAGRPAQPRGDAPAQRRAGRPARAERHLTNPTAQVAEESRVLRVPVQLGSRESEERAANWATRAHPPSVEEEVRQTKAALEAKSALQPAGRTVEMAARSAL